MRLTPAPTISTAIAPIALTCAVLALSGCSLSPQTPQTTPSGAPSPGLTPSATPAISATLPPTPNLAPTSTQTSLPPASDGFDACSPDDVEVSLNNSQGAAGHHYVDIVVRNVSASPCELAGYPGVSMYGHEGQPIDVPALREESQWSAIALDPGSSARATLGFTNPDMLDQCDPVEGKDLRIFLPNRREDVFVPADYAVCSTQEPSMQIGPFVAQ